MGGGWLGGVRGILLKPPQLPFQIRDLLLGVLDPLLFLGDLLSLLGELPPQLLHFAAQTFVLPAQYLAARRWTPFGARSWMRGSQRFLNIQIDKCFGLCPLLFSACRSPCHLNCDNERNQR